MHQNESKLQAKKLSKKAVHTHALFMDGFELWACIFGCAASGQMIEERGGAVGSTLGGPLLSMLFGFSLSAAGVIPSECLAYDTVVWRHALPLAASLYLLEADFFKLIETGGSVLGAFLIGAVGMVCGAVVGWKVVLQGMEHSSAIAASLCSSYVGGSINFVAVASCTKLASTLVWLPIIS